LKEILRTAFENVINDNDTALPIKIGRAIMKSIKQILRNAAKNKEGIASKLIIAVELA
jgi:hypothetical protein